jgi:hypothetical protein
MLESTGCATGARDRRQPCRAQRADTGDAGILAFRLTGYLCSTQGKGVSVAVAGAALDALRAAPHAAREAIAEAQAALGRAELSAYAFRGGVCR